MEQAQAAPLATVHVTPEMEECIQNCRACQQICHETINYSLKMGGRLTESVHMRLLLDGAEITQVCANFMLRASDMHREVCAACAVICENLATDCDRFAVPSEGSGAPMSKHSGPADTSAEKVDDQMKRCAEACRRCARSCRQMAGTALQA